MLATTEAAAMEQARILIVEDDAKLALLVQEYLQSNGFEVIIEPRGDRAPDRILTERPDLVILDLMLPGLDGLQVCREVRPRFPNPILMLTARGEEVDEVVGLELGADDYLAKPVRPRLLLARINALLRRLPQPAHGEGAIILGALTIEPANRRATLAGQELDLTTAEFDLLLYLARRAGEAVTREEIYRDLRGIEWDGLDRSIDLRVARLRRKLGDDGRNPQQIKSVRGTGYVLVAGS